jgi:hypothetical protein
VVLFQDIYVVLFQENLSGFYSFIVMWYYFRNKSYYSKRVTWYYSRTVFAVALLEDSYMVLFQDGYMVLSKKILHSNLLG